MMCLPVDTPMPKVVDAHRAHTSGHGLGLVRFTHESLVDQMFNMTKHQFDHMIRKGYYVPLTLSEVKRLGG